ncbi:argonaute/piwi family protein [Methanopyrus kandleri]
MPWRSNAVRVRMDFEVLRGEDYHDRGAARGAVKDHLREGEFAFQVDTVVYSAGDRGERVGWDDLSPTARAYAVRAALRLGLEGLGFELDTGYSLLCDRDFFEVCYGGRFDGERIPGVYALGNWREVRDRVLRTLGREYGPVEVRLGLEVRARALGDGTVLLSVDPRARAISRVRLRDMVRYRGVGWAERVLPGTYVIPTDGGLAGRRLKVVDAVPADEWEGEDGWDLERLREHWSGYGVEVDPEVVVTVKVGGGVLHYPDDVLRWQVPVHPVTEYFRLGVADRVSVGRYLLDRGLGEFRRRFPDVAVEVREHPGSTDTRRVRPPVVVVGRGGSGKRTELNGLLWDRGPYEGAGELDGEAVHLVADRELLRRAGISERDLRRLLELVVGRLRRLLGHDVEAGDVGVAEAVDLPDLVGDADGPVLVGVLSDDDRTYARVKRRDPLVQCFTERVLSGGKTVKYAATGLAVGIHCKHAGQPYAVRTTTSGPKDVAVVGVDVSREVEGGRVVEGRACCSCFVVDEDGLIEHGRTFTVPVGERGETSEKTAEIVLETAREYSDRVVYLRDGTVPGEELEAVREVGRELGLDVRVVEVIKSDPTVYAIEGEGWRAPRGAYVRLDGSTVHLCCSPYMPRRRGDKKPGTPRPIALRRRDDKLDGDLIGLVHDLTASNWGNPSGTWSRLPAPVLYADRAARLARYGVSVGRNDPVSERPWPV